VFLLVLAHLGSPGQRAVKQLLLVFWDHPGEPVPEQTFWTLWCKGRLTEADTPGQMPFLLPNQQCQSTKKIRNRKLRILLL